MLTRLKVSGFKNLEDTEIRLGPLTCIAGFNGVGKSNLFDAIHFLGRLADQPFIEAAGATRGGGELVELFTVGGEGRMAFDCDMLIPSEGVDPFQQPATASQTYLRYRLTLRLGEDGGGFHRVFLEHESLEYLRRGDAARRLGFPHSRAWRDSVVKTSHRRAAFIEMEDGQDGKRIVRLSSDEMRDERMSKRGGGRPSRFLADNLPRTALSSAQNSAEARTAVLARAEMRSWRSLQFEPSALRRPDDFQARQHIGADGSNLPAALYRLATQGDAGRVYGELSNRLAELVDDVRSVEVERDEARRVLRLVMTDRRGVRLPASSLSDGTLRFIALGVIAQDLEATGLLCLEEPENGIHPERMGAMLRLLRDMAVDPAEPCDEDNPLRQVIVSTHSPIVAARAAPDELVFADHRDAPDAPPGARDGLVIRPMAGTWRDHQGVAPIPRGDLLRYLGSVRAAPPADGGEPAQTVFGSIAGQLDLFRAGA